MLLKNLLQRTYSAAVALNHKNIRGLLEHDKSARMIDLGCDDGVVTLELAERVRPIEVHGVEIVETARMLASERGVITHNFDLNIKFPLLSESFDVVHANQVIEHLTASDVFVSEIFRILRPGGYAVISTENASSWCNVFASAMGWQIFSLTNFSSLGQGIGNPFALHRSDGAHLASWNHVRIYSYLGLIEYFRLAGFSVEHIYGAGYFPLPARIGLLDPRHAHFITYKIRK